MKILLYTEYEKSLAKSGLGRAIRRQAQILNEYQIPYTKNPQDEFDLAHINYYGPKSYRIAKKARKNGKKVIYHAHSTEEDFRNSFRFSNAASSLFKKWICRCYTLGNCILTPTPYSKSLLEGYGLQNVVALSNGVDTEFFCREEAAGKRFRQKYGFSEEDKVIVSIGLYLERKGILDFVELAKRMPDVKFIWFGHTDFCLIPRKIRKAVQTRLPNLHFPGFVEPDEIKAALNGADLFLFPTLEETEGIPILEACACRQKALIRDIPVFDGWLEDGVTVYKAKTLAEFEEKARGILEGTLPDLTEAAYKIACERDIRAVGTELIALYRRVLTE